MEKTKKWKILNALDLKLLAMALMLCDHLWATIVPGNRWLTDLGRLAFPIFAYQIVEGYFHTRNFKRYLGRLFLYALISEIPFNMMMTGGGLIDPFRQNVMFTFCIALVCIRVMDVAKQKNRWLYLGSIALCGLLGYFVGSATFVDYYGSGVLMVLVFYVFRGIPFGWVGELVCLLFINTRIIGGLMYPVNLFGWQFSIYQQGLAVLALIPIALYNGKQGPHNKVIQHSCYWFYPAHMLILSLLWRMMA